MQPNIRNSRPFGNQMSRNNRKKTEIQYRNNNIDIYQIQFRSSSKESIDDREGYKIDVETRISISIQTGDIYK